MGIVIWILAGAVLGFIASLIARKNDTVPNIIIGIVGAGLAGWIATLFGLGTFMVFDIWNLLISVAGAVVLLLVFYLVQRGRKA